MLRRQTRPNNKGHRIFTSQIHGFYLAVFTGDPFVANKSINEFQWKEQQGFHAMNETFLTWNILGTYEYPKYISHQQKYKYNFVHVYSHECLFFINVKDRTQLDNHYRIGVVTKPFHECKSLLTWYSEVQHVNLWSFHNYPAKKWPSNGQGKMRTTLNNIAREATQRKKY